MAELHKIRAHFVTPGGIVVPAVSAAQMREIDRIAIEETGPSLLQMMENAGRTLASFVLEQLGAGFQRARVLVLAGGGGNGGGGISAGRHLRNRNLDVCLLIADPAHMSEAAQWQKNTFQFAGGREIPLAELPLEKPGIIVDALIGYGLRSSPSHNAAEIIRWANLSAVSIVSLDVPSGADATTGDSPGESVRPTWTMTLALPKIGLLLRDAGDVFLADIGIPKEVYRRTGLEYVPPFGNQFYTRLERRSCR